MKQIIRKSVIIICCIFMVAQVTGCSTQVKDLLKDAKYIRVSDTGAYPSDLDPDRIIDSNDERFDVILNLLSNAEFSDFDGDGYWIGGTSILYLYGKDNRYIEQLNLGIFLFMSEEERSMDMWKDFGSFDAHFNLDEYNKKFKFAKEEDWELFKETVISLYEDAGVVFNQNIPNQ